MSTEVAEIKEQASPEGLVIVDERVVTGDGGLQGGGRTHSIRLGKDSYIFCFEGRRGGGKTTAMSFFVVRCVAFYNMRVVANYPLEFMLRRHKPDGKSFLQHIKAEPLDFEKLICQNEEYKHVLICIDEAPDIISHLASQSWRNRLVAAFTRQIRKNYNTLFLASQDFELIDKSMRWQVDVVIKCRDAAKTVGDNAGIENGEVLWLDWYDHSGQWTGLTTQDRVHRRQTAYALRMQLYPRFLWGDDTHKPVFDSWYQIDLLDSLRKVDLNLSSIKISDKPGEEADKYPVSPKVLLTALQMIDRIRGEAPDQSVVYQKGFFEALGGLTDADKNNLGRKLSEYGVERGGDGAKRVYGFGQFDIERFRGHVESISEKE